VDTATSLSRKQVFIAPIAIIEMDAIGKTIHLTLTIEQIQKSADTPTHKRGARGLQIDYFIYLGWPQPT
jgi:hypothetical protein